MRLGMIARSAVIVSVLALIVTGMHFGKALAEPGKSWCWLGVTWTIITPPEGGYIVSVGEELEWPISISANNGQGVACHCTRFAQDMDHWVCIYTLGGPHEGDQGDDASAGEWPKWYVQGTEGSQWAEGRNYGCNVTWLIDDLVPGMYYLDISDNDAPKEKGPLDLGSRDDPPTCQQTEAEVELVE